MQKTKKLKPGKVNMIYRKWLVIIAKILVPHKLPKNPHMLPLHTLEEICEEAGYTPAQIKSIGGVPDALPRRKERKTRS